MMNEIIMELNNRGYKAESTTVIKNGVEKVGSEMRVSYGF